MKPILLCIALLLGYSLSAQRIQDIVNTRDGATYRGQIIELYPDSILKIKAEDKSIYILRMADVKQVLRDDIGYTDVYSKGKLRSDSSLRQKGYTCISEVMGLSLYAIKKSNQRPYLAPGYSFSMVHGYLFNPRFSVGAGAGLDIGGIGLAIPVFADLRYNFLDKRVTPFVNATAGYSFLTTIRDRQPITELHTGNMNAGNAMLAFGAKFGTASKFYITTSMGYRIISNFNDTHVHAFAMKFGVVY